MYQPWMMHMSLKPENLSLLEPEQFTPHDPHYKKTNSSSLQILTCFLTKGFLLDLN